MRVLVYALARISFAILITLSSFFMEKTNVTDRPSICMTIFGDWGVAEAVSAFIWLPHFLCFLNITKMQRNFQGFRCTVSNIKAVTLVLHFQLHFIWTLPPKHPLEQQLKLPVVGRYHRNSTSPRTSGLHSGTQPRLCRSIIVDCSGLGDTIHHRLFYGQTFSAHSL